MPAARLRAPRGRPFRSLHGPGIRVAGASCSELALPACAVHGQPLRPTFLLHHGWERRLFRDEWMGPLTCSCIEQMARLRHLVQYNNPWIARRQHAVVCATGGEVGALLTAPQNATWRKMTLALLGTDTAALANQMPPVAGLGFFRLRLLHSNNYTCHNNNSC